MFTIQFGTARFSVLSEADLNDSRAQHCITTMRVESGTIDRARVRVAQTKTYAIFVSDAVSFIT